MRLIKNDESWKDYVTDAVQLAALITTIAAVLYCVTLILEWNK